MDDIDERSEPRTRSMLRARVRGKGLERDASIVDLSPHGLLMTAAMPPQSTSSVTISANGFTVSGQVRWVEGHQFGICLDAPIVVGDVVNGPVVVAKPREPGPGLPENFGARPVSASSSLSLNDYIQSKWLRYGLVALILVGGAVYIGQHVGAVLGGMSEQFAAVKQVHHAEHHALKH